MEVNAKLHITYRTLLPEPTRYHQLVESLVYLTITSLDISVAVHTISQFVAPPTIIHWAVS